ncbi:MAG TPA: SRPBCC family protein [Candidatus Acidoferrales bacterium]|jgi:activator of HSP90 ATPase|nr:SRPBCC family protein [Candidatus Acidoferrales bacterium]
MSEREKRTAPANTSTRRQVIAGLGIALGGLAAGSELWANTPQAMKAAPGAAGNQTPTSLHQEVAFKATPQRIYEVLLDSKQFAAFTGLPAEIDPKAGGAFKMFGGMIVGRNVELIPDQRIVQAWRPTSWGPGVYSIVKFELRPQGSGVLVVLDHTGFPEGDFDGLSSGWPERYWEPLKKFLV